MASLVCIYISSLPFEADITGRLPHLPGCVDFFLWVCFVNLT